MNSHHHSLRFVRIALAVLAVGLVLGLKAHDTAPATAAAATTELTYTADRAVTTEFFDSGLRVADEHIPGRLWYRIRFGTVTRVIISQDADVTVNPSSVAIQQGSTISVSTQLSPQSSTGKEFKVQTEPYVNLDLAFDQGAFGDECPTSFISSAAQLASAAAANTCLDVAVHTGNMNPLLIPLSLLGDNGQLPFTGSIMKEDTQSGVNLVNVGVLIGVPNLFLALDIHTVLTVTAGEGFRAERQVRAQSNNALIAAQQLHWTSPSLADPFALPCTTQANAAITYQLNAMRWGGTAKVTLAPRLELKLATGFGGIPLAGFDMASKTLFDAPLAITTSSIGQPLGTVAAETSKPTVGTTASGTGVEGGTLSFAAAGTSPAGSFDNCDADGDTLTYTWNFGDGGTAASGKNVTHTYTDNGTFNGTLTARDPAGNTDVTPFTRTISNVAPTGTLVANPLAVVNGTQSVMLSFGVRNDPSSADIAAGLTFALDCGNGEGYNAFSTGSSRNCPTSSTSQTMRGTVKDKDGGSTEYTITVEPSSGRLTVNRTGTGQGTVVSSPTGISCGPICVHNYGLNTLVTLTANAASGSTFAGWGGPCVVNPSTPNVCRVTVTGAIGIAATFNTSTGGTHTGGTGTGTGGTGTGVPPK